MGSSGWRAWADFALVLAALSAAGAASLLEAHSNIARIVTASGGPYTIMVGLITDPPRAGVPLEVTIGAVKGTPTLEGTAVTLTGEPGAGVTAAAPPPVHLTLEEDETEYFEGKITLPLAGAWTLRFEVRGGAGSGTALVPVTVVAP